MSGARLRQLARERQLDLPEDDLDRLGLMVDSLLAVAQGLRAQAARWTGGEGLDPDRKRAGGDRSS